MWPDGQFRSWSDDFDHTRRDAPPFRHPFHHQPCSPSAYRSRYTARYDSDRRSRSPRDRSPDRYNDRASQYSDGERRRTSGDSRGNAAAFQNNRDTFRDSLTGREPPRGPKALIDPPNGPRGGGYGGDFRGRGRGRGRGWRDDSRDRGRDRDDFRDRRDGPSFRDDRSRERERDWRERDSFRGRRPSPQGRGRSPPGRDFRDREGPLNVDADRARRESRDGPLSAGSSSSDPPFASQSYRGGSYRGRGGRGRGDWNRGDLDRGRGRNFYDERDRFRSRSQEGRWGRDRDDRDSHRYIDSDVRSRDSREDRDPRDLRDRDARPKLDRQGSIVHDPPPPTKDVSPPPLAPSAPAFGSVPSRQPSTNENTKPTPTGPRALAEDRPVSAGQQGGEQRLPPAGPSKSLAEVSPPIPTGPRAQHQKQQRPSSKQWINPALVGKNLKVPESPNKINRSQSFVASQQSRPFGGRPDSSNSDSHGDMERRPRSSGANADSQIAVADGQLRSLRISEPGEITFGNERGTQSARSSIDRELRASFIPSDSKSRNTEPSDRGSIASATSPIIPKAENPTVINVAPQGQDDDQTKSEEPKKAGQIRPKKRGSLRIPTVRFALPPKVSTLPTVDHSSESDDEDIDDYFEMEIAKAEAELNKIESVGESVPTDFVVRYASLSHEALVALATESNGLKALLGPFPEGFKMPKPRGSTNEKTPNADMDVATKATTVPDSAAPPTIEQAGETTVSEEPRPKVEEMDIDTAHLPIPTVEHAEQKDETGDVDMDDAGQSRNGLPTSEPDSTVMNGTPGEAAHHLLPPGFDQPPTGLSTPTQMEMEDDDDETEIEEIDYATIETVRQYMKTPPLDDLPRYQCRPWFKDRQYIKSLDPSPDVHAFVASLMRDSTIVTMAAQDEARQEYSEDYEMYLRFTLSDDPIALKSRDKFSVGNPNGDFPAPHPTGHEGKPEGRRTGRFATERDLERALQESLQAENERREREERASKEKYRSEKEAEIPDMYWTIEEREKDLFIDHSGFIPPERLIATWQVLPPVTNFTEEEAEQFEKAYLEFPKQWGKIAENIPTRDFHSCIQYYYIKKKDLNLKEKLKKQPRRRKKGGRGKQRSSALVTEVLGIGDENTEENHETGENGERRRPRRAAAPTFGPNHHDATNATDSDGTATPGRRHAGAKNDSGAEKTDRRRRRGREKEPKQTKPVQALAPTPPVAAKANRSRSNSRAQGPEFLSPQTPADLGRAPMQLDGSPGAGMQPPLVPAQPLLSPERAVPTTAGSSISEVMAPPSLRPEPIPPPPSIATFDINQHAAPDRMRTPQQASSYWSVSESNEFPALLRSFGTDWGSIAGHMQTKTHVMVKNYYVRQKDAGKVEWEAVAHEADQKRARGEKLPPPPTMTQGPRNKRYDTPATLHRPLAAAEAPEDVPTKLESHPPPAGNQPFSRFQVPVPIAQAPPTNVAPGTTQPIQVQQQQQVQPSTQAMSPGARPLRAPLPTHGYTDRDPESVASQPQTVRISQKPLASALASETQARGPGWLHAYDADESPNNGKMRRSDMQPKEGPRSAERTPLPLKQEPEQSQRYEPFAPREAPQPISRASARNEPISLARSVEPPRGIAPAPQAYPPASQQSVRNIASEQGQPAMMVPSIERPSSAMQRPLSTPMQDSYGVSPSQQPQSGLAPPAARPAERKTSSLMALLNDDPAPAPPPPKRVSEMAGSGLKPSSSPPPQALSSRAPPPSSAGQLRREETPVYGSYSRNTPVQSAIPSLKPYNPTQAQSPQSQHMNVPRGSMVSPVEAASAAERDYYARHAYPPQHQPPASNSPQSHHYPPPSQHSQMGYQSQGPSYPYGAPVSQPHAASPTPQYAGHPPPGGRREPVQQSRDTAWPPTQRQESSPASMQQQPTAWPPPKANQPPPTPSAWGAQHGAPAKAPPASNAMPPQAAWASAPPQHSFRDSLRDDRSAYPPVHDARGGNDPRMIGHHHQQSLTARYPPASNPRDGPPQAPQPTYPRYATPGPGQGRDLRDPGPPRSYTPGATYDARGPPPGPYAQDMQMRDARADPRDPRDPVSQLQRQLRPHEAYDRPPERRYQ